MRNITKLFFLLFIPFAAFSQPKQKKIDDLLNRYHEYQLFNGSVLVTEKNRIVYKGGMGYANMEYDIPNSERTVHRIGSVTKQFVSTMIMQLVEEGRITLGGRITEHINYRKDTGDRVTIHQLLTHTSGIPNYTNIPGFWSDSTRNPYEPDSLIKWFCSGDLEFEPGTQFSYSNSGYVILASLVEKVTGKSYEQNLKERIFDRLGMKSSYIDRPYKIIKNRASGYDKSGISFRNTRYMNPITAFGAGDIITSAEDLYLWDQGLYSNKILSDDSKKKVFTPYISNYGYGWGISKIKNPFNNDSLTQISHSGGINGFGSNITRILEDSILIVLINNTGPAPLGAIRSGIINILYNQEYDYPQKPIGNHLYYIIKNEGVDKAIERYREIKEKERETFQFNEGELNNLGYILLNENKIDEAIKIFRLNIEQFPNSYNTYDSMGEALMKKGDSESSIKYYKKSIELNPQNKNGYDMLSKQGLSIAPPKDADVALEILKMYEGKYNLFPNFNIVISENHGELFAQATGQGKFQIYPETESVYYYKVVDAKIEFVNQNGEVNKLILYQNNQEIPGLKVK